jgi:Zn-finger nucleic acid-binding protein
MRSLGVCRCCSRALSERAHASRAASSTFAALQHVLRCREVRVFARLSLAQRVNEDRDQSVQCVGSWADRGANEMKLGRRRLAAAAAPPPLRPPGAWQSKKRQGRIHTYCFATRARRRKPKSEASRRLAALLVSKPRRHDSRAACPQRLEPCVLTFLLQLQRCAAFAAPKKGRAILFSPTNCRRRRRRQ